MGVPPFCFGLKAGQKEHPLILGSDSKKRTDPWTLFLMKPKGPTVHVSNRDAGTPSCPHPLVSEKNPEVGDVYMWFPAHRP